MSSTIKLIQKIRELSQQLAVLDPVNDEDEYETLAAEIEELERELEEEEDAMNHREEFR